MGFLNMYIAASAGTGKTYQLVNRYIALLCIQKQAHGHIDVSRLIAITFTRKAAGEFKARILSEIALVAGNEDKARIFWLQRISPSIAELGFALPEPSSYRAYYLDILQELMEQFSKLKLGTIDSLFQSMLRALSSELGISKLSPIDPISEKHFKREALDAVYLAYSKEQQQEDKALEELITEGMSSEQSLSSPDYALIELIETYHELYLNAPDAQWGGDPDEMSEDELALFGLCPEEIQCAMSEQELKEQIAKLQDYIQERSDIFAIPERAESKLYTVGNAAQQIKLHANSVRGYLKAFNTFISSLGQTEKAIILPTIKLTPEQNLIEQIALQRYPQFWDACDKAGFSLNKLIQAQKAHCLRGSLKRSQALKHVIAEFEQYYRREVRENGLFTFSDIGRLLSEQLDSKGLEILQERLDSQLEHWMLDEFQDTSHEQYHILRDLLMARAQGGDDGSVFMVGDAKQSIYQFRGGDPAIFLGARSELFGLDSPDQTESYEMSMDASYRSSQIVLDLVNLIFGEKLHKHAALACPLSLAKWDILGFKPHIAANKKLMGEAAIWQLERKFPDELRGINENRDELHSEVSETEHLGIAIAELVSQIRGGNPSNPPSCAILIATKKEGRSIAEMLGKLKHRYEFHGEITLCEDKAVGHDSPLGLALLNFFKWLEHPGDKKSLSLLRITPLWDVICELAGESPWLYFRQLWEQGGVHHLLQTLVKNQQGRILPNDFMRQRWKTWIDAADQYQSQGSSNISEWIRIMDEIVVRDESAGNDILIMTIHKSKGLEFDHIILPQFPKQKSLAPYNRIKMLQRKDAHGKILATMLSPAKDVAIQYPQLWEQLVVPNIANEEFAGLCRLYVALTRAKTGSHIILPRLPKSKSSKFSTKTQKESKTENESLSITHLFREFCEQNDYLSSQHPTRKTELAKLAECLFCIDSLKFIESVHDFSHAKDTHIVADINKEDASKEDANKEDANKEEASKKNARKADGEEKPSERLRDYQFKNLRRSTPSSLDKDRIQEMQAEPAIEVAEEELLDRANAPFLDTPPSDISDSQSSELRFHPKARAIGELSGAQFGTKIHHILQYIGWLDEPNAQNYPLSPQAEDCICRALQSPSWQEALRRPAHPHRLYREQNIEALIHKTWISGQIDRLHVHYENGIDSPATSAHIYDFKTDHYLSQEALKAEYRGQMQSYRSMVALAFQLKESDVSVSLLHCPALGEPSALRYNREDWKSEKSSNN